MAGWGSEEGGPGAGCGRARVQGEGLWEGLRLCSLAHPWCMISVTASWIFCSELKLDIIPLFLLLKHEKKKKKNHYLELKKIYRNIEGLFCLPSFDVACRL